LQPSARTVTYTPPAAIAEIRGEKDLLKRKLLLAGYLTKRLQEEEVKTYVVGGFAAEVYTGGQFKTADVDLVASNTEKLIRCLEDELGFNLIKEGLRGWINEELGIAVDVVGTALTGSEDKVNKIEVSKWTVNLIGLEDLIVMNFCGFRYWDDPHDLERAYAIIGAHKEKIDWEYLRKKAIDEHVEDLLSKAREKLGC